MAYYVLEDLTEEQARWAAQLLQTNKDIVPCEPVIALQPNRTTYVVCDAGRAFRVTKEGLGFLKGIETTLKTLK